MDDPKFWIELIFTYGPFALLVLFLFVVERRAYKVMRETIGKEKLPCIVIYCGVWAAIAGLCGLSWFAWKEVNLPDRPVIAGTIENLTGTESLSAHPESLFVHRRKLGGEGSDINILEFRIESQKKLDDGYSIRLAFDRGPHAPTNVRQHTEHRLSVMNEYYSQKQKLYLRYDRDDYKLYLTNGNGQTTQELTAIGGIFSSHDVIDDVFEEEVEQSYLEELEEQSQRIPWSIMARAHAAERKTNEQLYYQLDSPDYFIRLEARRALAKQGTKAIPWISDVLVESPSSRQRYEVLAALNLIPQEPRIDLSDEGVEAVIAAAHDLNGEIRNEALRFMIRQRSWNWVARIDERFKSAQRAAEEGDANAAHIVSALARVKFELLYQLGIEAKDRFGDPSDLTMDQDIDLALDAFKDAWALRELVNRQDNVHLAKALYGWALALNDKWVVEKRRSGMTDDSTIEATKLKFQELLDVTDPKTYKYPDHLRKAKAYIADPDPLLLEDKPDVATVVYYEKQADGPNVINALENLNFNLRVGRSGNVLATNAIWFGEEVDLRDVKSVAESLVSAGVEIRSIRRFSGAGRKPRRIEVGSWQKFLEEPIYELDEIRNAAKFPRVMVSK